MSDSGGDRKRLRKEGRETEHGSRFLSLPPAAHSHLLTCCPPRTGSYLHLDESIAPTFTHLSIAKKKKKKKVPRLLKDSRSRLQKKSGTTELGVSDTLGFGWLRGGGARGGASGMAAASVLSSSHGGGSALRGQLHVKREGLKLPSCRGLCTVTIISKLHQ